MEIHPEFQFQTGLRLLLKNVDITELFHGGFRFNNKFMGERFDSRVPLLGI